MYGRPLPLQRAGHGIGAIHKEGSRCTLRVKVGRGAGSFCGAWRAGEPTGNTLPRCPCLPGVMVPEGRFTTRLCGLRSHYVLDLIAFFVIWGSRVVPSAGGEEGAMGGLGLENGEGTNGQRLWGWLLQRLRGQLSIGVVNLNLNTPLPYW